MVGVYVVEFYIGCYVEVIGDDKFCEFDKLWFVVEWVVVVGFILYVGYGLIY